MGNVERFIFQSIFLTTAFLGWFVVYSWTATQTAGKICEISPLNLMYFVKWSSLACAILSVFDLPLKYYQDTERDVKRFNYSHILRRLNVSALLILGALNCGWAIEVIVENYQCDIPNLFGLTIATAVIPIVIVCILLLGWFTHSSYLGFEKSPEKAPELRAASTINNRNNYGSFRDY